jgi:hypothetical protein
VTRVPLLEVCTGWFTGPSILHLSPTNISL